MPSEFLEIIACDQGAHAESHKRKAFSAGQLLLKQSVQLQGHHGETFPGIMGIQRGNETLVPLLGKMTRQFPHHGPVILKPMNKNNFHVIRCGTC